MAASERAASPGWSGDASQEAQELVANYGLACVGLAGQLGARDGRQATALNERRERALLAYIADLERRAGAGAGGEQ